MSEKIKEIKDSFLNYAFRDNFRECVCVCLCVFV